MNEISPQNCLNCGHRLGAEFATATCLKTGYACIIQRKYPGEGCDTAFSGWTPSEGSPQPIPLPTIRETLRLWLKRKLTP